MTGTKRSPHRCVPTCASRASDARASRARGREPPRSAQLVSVTIQEITAVCYIMYLWRWGGMPGLLSASTGLFYFVRAMPADSVATGVGDGAALLL